MEPLQIVKKVVGGVLVYAGAIGLLVAACAALDGGAASAESGE